MDRPTITTILLVVGITVISFTVNERLPYTLAGVLIGATFISIAVSLIYKSTEKKEEKKS